MRRIVVMGPPGSGKSTLARRLGARYGLPVFHLDQAYWQPGWVETPPAAFRAEIARIAALPAWVIDGNYTATIEPRFRAADTVIYLDVPSWLSMLRIMWRTLAHPWAGARRQRAGLRGTVRPGLPALRVDLEPDKAEGILPSSRASAAERSCCAPERRRWRCARDDRYNGRHERSLRHGHPDLVGAPGGAVATHRGRGAGQ